MGVELEAYAAIVSAFRGQGDLSETKCELLGQLQSTFRISSDRHKAELRRANNDELLFTIAKRLSHGESVSAEWTRHSKRAIPLLPRLDLGLWPQSEEDDGEDGVVVGRKASRKYRILADHIVAKSRPILQMFPDPSTTQTTTTATTTAIKEDQEKKLVEEKKQMIPTPPSPQTIASNDNNNK